MHRMLKAVCLFFQVGESDLECTITGVEEDGTISMQLSSPTLLALNDYYKEAEESLKKIANDAEAYLKLRATAPLDPNTVYLAPHNNKIFRVKVLTHDSDWKMLRSCVGNDLKSVSL